MSQRESQLHRQSGCLVYSVSCTSIVVPPGGMRALAPIGLFEAKSQKHVSENQCRARLNFPVFSQALMRLQGLLLMWTSATRNACRRPLKNKGFKEDASRKKRG